MTVVLKSPELDPAYIAPDGHAYFEPSFSSFQRWIVPSAIYIIFPVRLTRDSAFAFRFSAPHRAAACRPHPCRRNFLKAVSFAFRGLKPAFCAFLLLVLC